MRAAAFALVVLAARAVAERPHQISQSGFGAYEASLTPFRKGFVAAWYDTRDGHPEIYARLLDADGRPASPEWRLTRGKSAAYEPDVAASGDSFVVGWYERDSNARYRAMVGAWTKDGRPSWTHRLSPDGRDGRNAVVRTRGAEVFCAWIENAPGGDPEIRAQWLDMSGRMPGASRSLAPASTTTWNLNAAVDDQGSAWVAFDSKTGTRNAELFLARIDKAETRVVRLTTDDGKSSKYPDLALLGGRAALTWFDDRDGNQEVYLLVAPIDTLKGGVDKRALRVTRTAGESIGAYVA